MKSSIIFYVFIVLSLFIISCGSKRYDHHFPVVKNLPFADLGNPYGAGRMKTLYLAEQLSKNLKDRSLRKKKIAVLPFYNLESFDQTTPFGQYMSEQLISELSELGFNVVEIRNSQSIYMARKIGKMFLLRSSTLTNTALKQTELEELKKVFGKDLVGFVCGTYFNSGETLGTGPGGDDTLYYINIRIVSVPDSLIVSTASAEIAIPTHFNTVKRYSGIESVTVHLKSFE